MEPTPAADLGGCGFADGQGLFRTFIGKGGTP